jgi:tetratricopeptide (TPR) repeat protein
MKQFKIYLLLFAVLLATGCNKFLDVAPKGKFIPRTVADYELFLNDLLLADAGYGNEEFMTDDLSYSDKMLASLGDGRTAKSYLWLKDLMKLQEDDQEWNNMYRNIYNCNLVLANIGTATNGTAEDIARLTAEAKVQRAYYYFHLANLFGNDYQPVTAATDLAVPLLLQPDLEAKTARATVKEVYDQVLKDLSEALAEPDLPALGRNYVHPGKAAAYALQARIFLFMGDYSQALQAANAALAIQNTLFNYNSMSLINPARPYSGFNNRPVLTSHPENIFTKNTSLSGILVRFMGGDDLLALLGEKDLRYVYNFTRLDRTGAPSTNPKPDYFGNYPNYSIGVPEMLLIKAECLARSGNKDESIDLLNTLRRNRFKPADYSALTAADAADALAKVLEERRRELFYHGLRWFDLKRLNREDRFKKTLTRVYNGQTYTLAPGDPRYLLQIAPKIIQINPAIIQNPR